MQNIVLTIAYDGTRYLGWQKTFTGPSIEDELEKGLLQLLQEPITLQAASRTDAGVHASGQVVNFYTKKSFDLTKLQKGLNALLPKDIVVLDVKEVDLSFHPTLDSVSKEYRYNICYGNIQLPENRFYSWHWPYPLNVSKMREACGLLIGQHDFSAFCNFKRNSHYSDFVREIYELTIHESDTQRLQIGVKGNHFLYKMVRNIVGTLVYVGAGKMQVDEVAYVLTKKDRKLGAMTAPAHGLFLHQIIYS